MSGLFKSKLQNQLNLCTTSCIDALEMAATVNIKPNDEVIMPQLTHLCRSINPFILRGAKIKFVDSRIDHPGIDESKIEVITTKQKQLLLSTMLVYHVI